ncbi:MAG: Hint domain-containing protein [Methylocella sp.]
MDQPLLAQEDDPTKAWVKKMLPVRVARSALGLDVPCADLYVTKEHALLIDGVLVTAGSLINGTTITVYDPRELDELEFFHIKLELHNAIYAEGTPCETMRNVEESARSISPNTFGTMVVEQPERRRARHCSAAPAVGAK